MPQFKYLARKPDGKLIDGVLTCNDRAAAIHQVEQQGGVPIKIEALAASDSPRRPDPASPAANRRSRNP